MQRNNGNGMKAYENDWSKSERSQSHPGSMSQMRGGGMRRNRMPGNDQSYNGGHMSDRGSMSPQGYGQSKNRGMRNGYGQQGMNGHPMNGIKGRGRGGSMNVAGGPASRYGGSMNRGGSMSHDRSTGYRGGSKGRLGSNYGAMGGQSHPGGSMTSSAMNNGGYGGSRYNGNSNGRFGHPSSQMNGGSSSGGQFSQGYGGGRGGGGSRMNGSNGRSRQQGRNDFTSNNGNGNNDQAYKLAALGEEIAGPLTKSFSCKGKKYGYYADVANGCKVYHVCAPEQRRHFSFFCNSGTIFDRDSQTCVRKNQITCKA